jgi:putative phage-type endonuclease
VTASASARIPDAGTPAWSAYRGSLRGIGASDAPAVLGLDPFRGPFDVWEQQTGRAAPVEQTKPMERGNRLEDVAADWTAERTGLRLAHVRRTIRDPRWPHLFAHPDRRVIGASQLVQVKTRWRDFDGGEVPLGVQAQVQQEMALTHTATCTVAVMTFEELFLHEVPADPETWAEMSERLEAWYVRHVEGDEPPRDLSDAYGRHLARTSPDGPPRRATTEEDESVRALREVRARQKALDLDETELLYRLKEGFGGTASVTGDGWHITWPMTKGRRTVAWQEVAAAAGATPGLIEEHTTTSEPTRGSFRLWDD